MFDSPRGYFAANRTDWRRGASKRREWHLTPVLPGFFVGFSLRLRIAAMLRVRVLRLIRLPLGRCLHEKGPIRVRKEPQIAGVARPLPDASRPRSHSRKWVSTKGCSSCDSRSHHRAVSAESVTRRFSPDFSDRMVVFLVLC